MILTDPYAVFAAAQQRWRSAVYPAHVTYGIAISVSKDGVTSQAHYHASYDSAQNRVTIHAVSDEEIAHPYTPHGMNVAFNLLGAEVPLSAPQQTFDYLGVPMLAPNYSFGIVASGPVNTVPGDNELVQAIRDEFHDPLPLRKRQSDQQGLKTIAEVAVAHRRYAIALQGTEPLDGHVDYHLTLRPLANPGMYRLRDMWVDTATFVTDRVVTDGNFTAAALGGVRWRTDFVQIAGAPFISSETALSGFTLERRSYDSATVAINDIVPAGSGAPFSALARFSTSSDSAPPILSEPAKPRI